MSREAISHSQQRLQYAICALLLWLPLPLGSNRLWSNGLAVFLIALIGVFWVLLHHRGTFRFSQAMRRGAPLIACLLFVQTWAFIQLLFGLSIAPSETFLYFTLGLAYTLLFTMVLDLFHNRKALLTLLYTLFISGTLQAFYGTSMVLSGLEWGFLGVKTFSQGEATGTFVNRNHLAGYLELALACGVGLLMAHRNSQPLNWQSLIELFTGPKARIRLALAITVIALVMTHSRMGNTAFFSSLLVVGSVLALRSKKHRLRYSLILVSLIVIDMLIISQYFGLQKLQERLVNTQFEDRLDGATLIARENVKRDDVANYAWSLLEDRPLVGSGAGTFEVAFPQLAGPDLPVHFDHLHNDYLQFGIEYGAIGLLGLIGFIGLAFYHSARALIRVESHFKSGVGFAACMGLLALMIHSAADFNLQIPANAATFLVVSAMGLLARFQSASKPATRVN